MQVLFLCILYYVNFLKRSGQQILNGLVDAVHMKTCMYSKLFDPTEQVPQCSRDRHTALKSKHEGVCLLIFAL